MNTSFSKILVPYDGTKSSDKAFNNIIQMAKKHNSTIMILTCIQEKFSFGFFKSKGDKNRLKQQKIMAEKKIKLLNEIANKNKISLKSKILVCDSVYRAIISYAKKHHVDIIAMSQTKLKTNADQIYYDSTVKRVFEHTPCSFLYIQ